MKPSISPRKAAGTLLVVEDDGMVRHALIEWLEIAGHRAIEAEDAQAALVLLNRHKIDLVLSDVRMPGLSGVDLLARLRAIDPDLPVVLITGHGDVPMAVSAMQLGAHDFVTKPYDPDHLAAIITRALRHRQLACEVKALRENLSGLDAIEARLVGASRSMEALKNQARKLAHLPTDIILYGETGTGKDVLAQCLHAMGSRAKGPFIAINCAAIPAELAESELFGHEEGAFSGARGARTGKFEAADGGTIFLDEIESMPIALQAKVLRVLQERHVERLGSNRQRPVDIRVFAAAKTNLLAECQNGRFRADLYYRLAGAELSLPPLRERDHDALILFELFAMRAAEAHGLVKNILSPRDSDAIIAHDWPGNVRELKALAERFAFGLLESDGGLSRHLLGQPGASGEPTGLVARLETFERGIIGAALATADGSVAAAAERLQIPRRTLSDRMTRLGLRQRP